MKFDHPSIIVEEAAQGYFSITGIPSRGIMTPEGQIVPPDRCIIHAGIPAALLRQIADALDGGAPVEVLVPAQTGDSGQQGEGEEDGEVVTLETRIVNILAEGNIQINKLAERLDVAAEEIKALDEVSEAFHIAHAGWVKAGAKPAEQ